ncbi:MAG: zinc ribbon domain-containing protein [Desulfobacterales bacterium]|nr:zinc ribbon domain-containing protein [Desulfobacterales bacterium]
MPIYEFKCDQCHDIFELVVMNSNDDQEIKCPKCESQAFERVMSATNYHHAYAANAQHRSSTQSRSCSTGSCHTLDIPGAA